MCIGCDLSIIYNIFSAQILFPCKILELFANSGAFGSVPAGCMPAQQLYHVLLTAGWPCRDQIQLSLLNYGDDRPGVEWK